MYTIGSDSLTILDPHGIQMAVATDVWSARDIVDALNKVEGYDEGDFDWASYIMGPEVEVVRVVMQHQEK